jgi:hypothetical protein
MRYCGTAKTNSSRRPRPGRLGGRSLVGGAPWRPPEQEFQDVDYVAIPRFPTLRSTLVDALAAYGGYLSAQFSRQHETPDWTVLKRRISP